MKYASSSGLLDYGARLYDPALARWISVDPLAESSVSMSPFVYCYNNPINVIDPDGMYGTMIVSPSGVSSQDWTTLHGGVTYEQWCEGRDQYSGGLYFIGEATSDLLQEIEKISTLRFSVAANGQVSAKGRPKNDADRKLLEIINNQFVMVLIESMKGVQSSQGVNVFGGAFAGSELYKNFSISKQVVAPEALSAIDTAIGKPGYTVMHEIDEAYIGGRLAHAEQTDVSPAYAGQENRIYKRAHASTSWSLPEGDMFYYDSNNNRVYDRAQASFAYLMILINGAYKEVMPWPL